MTTVIWTRGLVKQFRRVTALSDCDVTVPEGRICALIGPNGAGKTTLLRLLSGLARPTAGEMQVLGGTPRQDPAFLAEVGFLAQEIPLYRRFTAEEHIGIGAKVAIKVLRGAAAVDASEIARLRREARVQGSIEQPNVVRTLDLDQMPDGSIYVVMELLHGMSLAQRLKGDFAAPRARHDPIRLSASLAEVLERTSVGGLGELENMTDRECQGWR